MDRETTRRAVLAAVLAGGVGAAAGTGARTYLDRFAPFSGEVWDDAGVDLPATVGSPYGEATISYDDRGVPHIQAEDRLAMYYAAGYAQGADRLFQTDLQRRQMRGELSEVVGDATLDSDRFHVKMDFVGAAEANLDLFAGTEVEAIGQAFVDGINVHVDDELPVEFDLLGYEPDPFTLTDIMLAEKQISWSLTGSFRTLRKETLAATMGADVADTLHPNRLDHDASILGHERVVDDGSGAALDDGGFADGWADRERAPREADPDPREAHPALTSWLSAFEREAGIGSNSWVVSGELTDSGAPMMANDPHLTLMAPPVWYEMHLTTTDMDVRGVTFPGVPFVVIGENADGAWGFTNAGCDVIDFYEYETRGGADGEYRYGDEWREFEVETRTVAVADGEDEEVQVRKTVHGPVLDVESDGDDLRSAVAVAWTGLAATATTRAVIDINRAGNLAEFEAALREFDLPTQNCVYADRHGDTLYRVTGKVPIRRTDGEPVPGRRVFDGSAREGEWSGYTPYGESSWEGFIPFEEMPHERNPPYLGTANQRIVNDADYPHYVAEAYSEPFRGIRLWERLDDRVAGDDPVDAAFMRDLHRDAFDNRAAMFVPTMLDARGEIDDEAARRGLDALEGWDFEMTRDSQAALVFARFLPKYRERVFRPRLEKAMGDHRDVEEYFGSDWVLINLPPDSGWFPEGRPAAIEAALADAMAEIEAAGWESYGDWNVTSIDHPFDRSWLNYPRYPSDGSGATLDNFHPGARAGSSWRQVCPMDGSTSECILPGGNNGSLFSEHYHDQLREWADGEYKPLTMDAPDETTVRFEVSDR